MNPHHEKAEGKVTKKGSRESEVGRRGSDRKTGARCQVLGAGKSDDKIQDLGFRSRKWEVGTISQEAGVGRKKSRVFTIGRLTHGAIEEL